MLDNKRKKKGSWPGRRSSSSGTRNLLYGRPTPPFKLNKALNFQLDTTLEL